MTAPGISGEDIEELLAQVERAAQRIQEAVQQVFDNVNRLISWLPGFIVDEISQALSRLAELVRQAFEELTKLLQEPGWPPALLSAGEGWTTQVGARASNLVSTMHLDHTHFDDAWSGDAAKAFSNTLPRQKDALAAIKAATDELQKNLNDIARGIITFWVAVAAAVTSFAAAVAAAAAACATGVGAPAGVGLAVTAAAAFIVFLGSAVTALNTLLTSLSSGAINIQQQLTNNNAFENGNWPRSTQDLSDASLTDGDGTDWHVNP